VIVDSESYYYQGHDYGDLVLANEPDDMQVVDQFLGIRPGVDPATGKALPAPSSVTVSVENGTGRSGQAGTTASALQALGYQVVGTGDTAPAGAVSETMVLYNSPGARPAAEQVVRSLSGAVAFGQGPTLDGAQVTVMTGSNFAVNRRASSAPSQGASGTSQGGGGSSSASSTGSASGALGSAALAAPSPSTQPLAPWDPRSCTASGGEGS
jgi:LytR cell envelope-related transcriptional attenuator